MRRKDGRGEATRMHSMLYTLQDEARPHECASAPPWLRADLLSMCMNNCGLYVLTQHIGPDAVYMYRV